MSHRPTRRPILAGVTALAAALALCSCTAASVASAPTPKSVTATPKRAAVDHSIALTCAVLGSMQTAIEDAGIERSTGKLDDAAYAAVLETVPNTLSGLRRNTQAGMQDIVWELQEAQKTSQATSVGATFDPHAADFSAAMQHATATCARNHTQIVVYLPPGQG